MKFVDLGLSAPILHAVQMAGYELATPIQAGAIPYLLAGRDLLGSAQTGTGKTAAFALPILHRLSEQAGGAKAAARGPRKARLRALILSPTRELANQIAESFDTYGAGVQLRQTVIYGGVGYNPQIRALRQGVDILVATPGRLLDLMNQGAVRLGDIQMLVLDEADRMLDMGFMPDLKRIMAELPEQRQNILFSATFPSAIAELANELLENPAEVRIQPESKTADLIEQSVCFAPRAQKIRLLSSLVRSDEATRTIVFTRTKHGADRIVDKLTKAGVRAEAIHGNKTQNARQKALDSFRNGRASVLVATDVAARGIDVDDISHVVNYDLPNEAETYVHRIGRTARGGASGTAISLCDHDERKYLKQIEKLLGRTLPTLRLELTPEPEGVAPVVAEDVSPKSRHDRRRRQSNRDTTAVETTSETGEAFEQETAAQPSRGGPSYARPGLQRRRYGYRGRTRGPGGDARRSDEQGATGARPARAPKRPHAGLTETTSALQPQGGQAGESTVRSHGHQGTEGNTHRTPRRPGKGPRRFGDRPAAGGQGQGSSGRPGSRFGGKKTQRRNAGR